MGVRRAFLILLRSLHLNLPLVLVLALDCAARLQVSHTQARIRGNWAENTGAGSERRCDKVSRVWDVKTGYELSSRICLFSMK